MSPSYLLNHDAQEDLAQIAEQIAAESGLDRAESVVDRIERAFELLAERPGIGHARRDLARNPRLRCWRVFSYLILYLPADPRLELVVIVRIVHGARDPQGIRRQRRL